MSDLSVKCQKCCESGHHQDNCPYGPGQYHCMCLCKNEFDAYCEDFQDSAECYACGSTSAFPVERLHAVRFTSEAHARILMLASLLSESLAEPLTENTECPTTGLYRFQCDCGNTFSGLCEGMQGSAKCYNCNRRNVRPAFRLPKNEMGPRQSKNTHSCNLCHGSGICPLKSRRPR